MKRINKVLLVFVLLTSAFFWILWRGVQTEQFGVYLSNKIKKTVYKSTNLKISFERIDISLFPPSTTMRSFEVFDKESGTSLKANYLGLSFGLTDLISPNLSIGEVFMDDAELIVGKTKSDRKGDFQIENLFSEYQDLYGRKMKVRIKTINIKNTKVHAHGHEFVLGEFNAALFPSLVTSEAHIESIMDSEKQNILLDQVNYEMQLSEDGLRIKNIELYDGISKATLMGRVKLEKSVGLNLLFNYSGGKNLNAMRLVNNLPPVIREMTGSLGVEGKISGTLNNPQVESTISIRDFKSKYAKLNNLDVKLSYASNVIRLISAQASVNNGRVQTNPDKDIFDLKQGKLLVDSLELEMSNMHSNDFLYFIREDLDPLKLRFSGKVRIFPGENSVRIEPQQGTFLSGVKLLNKKGNKTILEPRKDISWVSGRGVIVDFDGGVNFDTLLKLGESDLLVQGRIDKNIEMEANSVSMDLNDLGPISGTSLEGKGELNIKISGPASDVRFFNKFKIQDFKVVNMNLGEIEGSATLSLKDVNLKVKIDKGRYVSSVYEGEGLINFEGENNLDIKTNIIYGSFRDIEKMAPNVFEGIKKYTKYLSTTIQGNLAVYGGFRKDLLGVKGYVQGGGKYQKELIDSYNFNFNYLKEKLAINDVTIKKSNGKVTGKTYFDFVKGLNEYEFDIGGIFLRDLQNVNETGLGYNGLLSGKISGNGSENNPNSKIDLRITRGQIGEYEVADSIISLHQTGEQYFIRTNIFEGELVMDSIIDFDKRKKNASKLNLKIDSVDLRKLLGVLSLHNLDDREMSGAVRFLMDMDFDTNNILSMTANARLEKFRWFKKNELIEVENPATIRIENGEIKEWNLETSNLSRNNISLAANGNFLKKVKIDSNFKISSIFADVLTDKLNFRSGDLNGRFRIIGEEGSFSTYLELIGEEMTLKPVGLRTPLNKLNFSLILDGDKININSLEADIGGGKLLATGNGKMKLPYPELKIFLEGENIRQPLFKRSYFIFDSTLTLEGRELPYEVSGKANIKAAEIRDELKDMKDDSMVNQGYRKYIPKAAVDNERSPIVLDIEARMSQPISIKNSLLDMNLTGKVELSNTLKNTLFLGKVKLTNAKNLLYLKGHEFVFEEGEIDLIPAQEEQQIKLNFLALAKINEYDVFTSIKGTTDDLIVDMYSRPDLSQGDLLSLVTLGVTSDVSQNLGERERQSVTTLGLGGIVLDQLGINQNLNKSFGLKVSVAPDIEQDRGSLLRGRNEDAGSSTGMKTGTKVEVKKEVAEKVDLSLSSTVGGASKQKQKMNVDVKINEEFSLQGVYEMRSTDELEEVNTDSMGADLKWRFSF